LPVSFSVQIIDRIVSYSMHGDATNVILKFELRPIARMNLLCAQANSAS